MTLFDDHPRVNGLAASHIQDLAWRTLNARDTLLMEHSTPPVAPHCDQMADRPRTPHVHKGLIEDVQADKWLGTDQ